MFVGISNIPRPYAWGSETAIAEQLGRAPSGGPEAELWLGAHPGSPSRITEPGLVGGAADLAAWIAADPQRALGGFAGSARLPFLLKLLAAGSPLSLQAHPTAEQAREGFRLENEAGVPIDSPERSYKDEFAKPELIYALSERFEALCGFRPLEQFRAIVAELAAVAEAIDPELGGPIADLAQMSEADDALPALVEWLSLGGDDVDSLIETVTVLAGRRGQGAFEVEFATLQGLAQQYPGDPGIVISLLLNHVSLTRGEVLYLPTGNIHAYLSGLGVELMAASDNVLRGGLTPKHVDVPELLSVLDFDVLPVPHLAAETPEPGVSVYRPDIPDFVLVRVEGGGGYSLTGPAIALCTSGSVEIAGAASSARVARGESVYVTPDEGRITVTGSGELFVATTG